MSESKLDFEEIYKVESWGFITTGVSISAHGVSRPLPKEVERVVWKAAEEIHQAVQTHLWTSDPKNIEQAADERKSLLALFGEEAIFIEEIPNGYMNTYYTKLRPWFIVTTRVGRIKLGWRKRVISIEWPESLIAGRAEELFPTDTSTKVEKLIHAWSYQRAGEIIWALLAAPTTQKPMASV